MNLEQSIQESKAVLNKPVGALVFNERRRVTRGKVSASKETVASFAVTPVEKRRLQRLAAQQRMSLSSFLRKHLQALL